LRLRLKPPPAEAEHIASEIVRKDSSLQRRDIVVTDRGFFLFLRAAPDGINNEFVPVPNPLPSANQVRAR
jgi:hypothetical protein